MLREREVCVNLWVYVCVWRVACGMSVNLLALDGGKHKLRYRQQTQRGNMPSI